MTNLSLRYRILLRLVRRFWRLWFVWWRTTMFFGKPRIGADRYRVRVLEAIPEIPARLGWGRSWHPDPLNGNFDIMRHPRRIEKRLILEQKPGDCDEHAIYWCASLLRSGLAKEVWLCTYSGIDLRGKLRGHAVCVFSTDAGLFYADYGIPVPLKWLNDFADIDGAKRGVFPLWGTRARVRGLSKDDTPIFDNYKLIEFETGE